MRNKYTDKSWMVFFMFAIFIIIAMLFVFCWFLIEIVNARPMLVLGIAVGIVLAVAMRIFLR